MKQMVNAKFALESGVGEEDRRVWICDISFVVAPRLTYLRCIPRDESQLD